jgi:hypothetical protein
VKFYLFRKGFIFTFHMRKFAPQKFLHCCIYKINETWCNVWCERVGGHDNVKIVKLDTHLWLLEHKLFVFLHPITSSFHTSILFILFSPLFFNLLWYHINYMLNTSIASLKEKKRWKEKMLYIIFITILYMN